MEVVRILVSLWAIVIGGVLWVYVFKRPELMTKGAAGGLPLSVVFGVWGMGYPELDGGMFFAFLGAFTTTLIAIMLFQQSRQLRHQ